jgi:hypothetical protein
VTSEIVSAKQLDCGSTILMRLVFHRKPDIPLSILEEVRDAAQQHVILHHWARGCGPFMHLGLHQPSRMVQKLVVKWLQYRWRWRLMPPQQQRLLLAWTPAAEEAARQERHKDAGAKTLAEVGQH